MKPFNIVVCHYEKDLSWTSKLNHPFTVYNKNPNKFNLFVNNLPNVGHDSFAYFTHVVNNYKNLPDYLAFVQDYPFDHCPNTIDILNSFNFSVDFLPLGNIFCETMEIPHINSQIMYFSNFMGFNVVFPVYYTRGNQYIISKKLILRRPIEFYEKILESLKHSTYPESCMNLEKLCFQMYGIYKPEGLVKNFDAINFDGIIC